MKATAFQTVGTDQDLWSHITSMTGDRRVGLVSPILVEFFEGDHIAALAFRQILYWTEHTNDPNGWFYKRYRDWHQELNLSEYQVRRVVRGDNRVRQPKRTFWSIGLETDVRMAPNGRNATFYRLDASAFMTAFSDWYENEHKGVTSEGVMTQCIARWGKPGHDAQKALDAAHLRLGEELTAQVLDRCLKAGGNSWRYAETSLSNEAAAAKTVVSCQDNFDVKATDKFEDATPAAVFPPLGNVPRLSVRGHMTPSVPGAPYEPVAPDPSVEETWVGSPAIPARSVAALWDEALLCIKLRDGDAYETHFHDLHLVAFDAETITFTVVTDSHYYDHVKHSARMTRALRCQLRQVMALAPTNTVNIVWHSRTSWLQLRE